MEKQTKSAVCFGLSAPRASDAQSISEQVGPTHPPSSLPPLQCKDSPGTDGSVGTVFKDPLDLLSLPGQLANYD